MIANNVEHLNIIYNSKNYRWTLIWSANFPKQCHVDSNFQHFDSALQKEKSFATLLLEGFLVQELVAPLVSISPQNAAVDPDKW